MSQIPIDYTPSTEPTALRVSSRDSAWDEIQKMLADTAGSRLKLAGEHMHEEHQAVLTRS